MNGIDERLLQEFCDVIAYMVREAGGKVYPGEVGVLKTEIGGLRLRYTVVGYSEIILAGDKWWVSLLFNKSARFHLNRLPIVQTYLPLTRHSLTSANYSDHPYNGIVMSSGYVSVDRFRRDGFEKDWSLVRMFDHEWRV